jgi:hypothetical protein
MGDIVVTVATSSSGGDIPITDATVSWSDQGGTHHLAAGLDGSVTITLTGVSRTLVSASAPGFLTRGLTGVVGSPLLIELGLASTTGGSPGQASKPPAEPSIQASWSPNYTQIEFNWRAQSDTSSVTYWLEAAGVTVPNSQATRTVIPQTPFGEGTYSLENEDSGPYSVYCTASNAAGSSTQGVAKLPVPPPPSISDLTAAWNSDYTAVTVSWSLGMSPVKTLQLDRFAGKFQAGAAPDESIVVKTAPFNDVPPNISQNSPTYQYTLTATGPFGENTATSNIVASPSKPAVPTNVVAKWVDNNTQASVSWEPVAHATSYEVLLFRTDADGPEQSLLIQLEDHKNITTTTFNEPLVAQNAAAYQYQVVALNQFGASAGSALTDSATLFLPAPASTADNSGDSGSEVTGTHHPLDPRASTNFR